MFPINNNDAYRNADGSLTTIEKKIESGGGGSDIPEYSSSDAGKVLTVGEDGELEWDEKGGSGGVFVGTTPPASSLGSDGDYYYQRTDEFNILKTFPDTKASGSKIYGTEYIINKSMTITKLRGMLKVSHPAAIRIGNLTEILASSPEATRTADEWFEYELPEPISVTTNDHIIVQIVVNDSENRGDIAYNDTSGVVYNDDLITYVQARYNGYPGTQEANKKVGAVFVAELPYEIVTNQYFKNANTWIEI